MRRLVKKFGGSSLACLQRVRHAAHVVAEAVKQGDQVVVVVSAMQGETDRLLALCGQENARFSGRDKAALLATGEQASAALFALTLQALGVPAFSMNGAQAGILTGDQYERADILSINSDSILQHFPHVVPVITGYQGVNSAGEFTTLGRGGSDLTAVAVAHAIDADECHIYTDVEGVYSADPRVVPDAGLIDTLSYSEMLALAACGAKVLQMRAVEYGSRFGVSIRVRSTFSKSEGTLIRSDSYGDDIPTVVGLGLDQKVATFCVRNLQKVNEFRIELFEALEIEGVDVDMFTTSNSTEYEFSVDVKFTVALDDRAVVELYLKNLMAVFGFEYDVSSMNAKISVVGMGLQHHAGIAARILSLFSHEKVNFEIVHSTACRISFVLPHSQVESVAQLLNQHYILEKELI